MAQPSAAAVRRAPYRPPNGITRLEVSGFKSIADDQAIDIRPLTLLSGTNSSGKSSMLQPLLLLKQTLEANFDPGPLLLTGANVKFNSAEQPFSRSSKSRVGTQFSCSVIAGDQVSCRWQYSRSGKKAIDLTAMEARFADELISLRPAMSMSEYDSEGNPPLAPSLENSDPETPGFRVTRRGVFLDAVARFTDGRADGQVFAEAVSVRSGAILGTLSQLIRSVIHLPGLRGNAERNYPVTAIGPTFPGTFEAYTASVIAKWQEENDTERIDGLRNDLQELGLTWTVEASAVNATAVEVLVGRLPKPSRGGAADLVSIADVGVGVSQTLPVLVALQQALPGQLVYIEQPEIHLHPRAQAAMAAVLVRAAKRGVRVVAETHSSHILTGVQSLVAEGEIAPEDVVLHWFTRDTKGATQIATANLDESGAYGDWPEDFSETTLDAQDRYIRAAFEKLPPRAS